MKNKSLKYGLIAAAIIIAAAAATTLWVHRALYGAGAVNEESSLYIYPDAEYSAVTDSLMPRLRRPWAYRLYAKRLNLPETFKAGHYRLTPSMSTVEVVRNIKLGLQTPVQVAINNARIPAHLASKLARQIAADSASIASVLYDRRLAAEMGFDSVTFYSMFIPDTYEFYWTVTPEDFVRRMRREYDAYWTPERDAKRLRSGLTRLQVMTLASIVYEETRAVDEMPRIAGVYINRLRKGILLQADPTVKYAMQDFQLRRILKKHLKYPSPYNTYVTKGLPPSPIAMPSKDAIEAVLDFEQHDYIFFCARPEFDGHHNFARTYSEHLANARAYSRELDRRKIK